MNGPDMTNDSGAGAASAGAARTAQSATLQVRDLTVTLDTPRGHAQILRGVSFDVAPGEVVALAGESGSGKSTIILALLRLLPGGVKLGGSIRYGGADVATMRRRELLEFRARTARVIFQDPWNSMHPMTAIGAQLVESARAADPTLTKAQARDVAASTLARVGIPDPASRLSAYPHQFSGGQLQRVMIAQALVASPKLLLCDEPTTALDVTTQAQILELLRELNQELGISIIIATHDLEVITDISDRLIVVYGGRIAENAATQAVLRTPRHPYSWSLLQAAPGTSPDSRLRAIDGRPPSPLHPVAGCAFGPRCPHRRDVCAADGPELRELQGEPGHYSACVRVEGYSAVNHVLAGEKS